ALVAALKDAMPEVDIPVATSDLPPAAADLRLPLESPVERPADLQFWSPEPPRYQDIEPAAVLPPVHVPAIDPPLAEPEPLLAEAEPPIADEDFAEPIPAPPA